MLRMVIHVALGDITQLTVDAIVNPANSLGIMENGVARTIKVEGGEAIEGETRSAAPVATCLSV